MEGTCTQYSKYTKPVLSARAAVINSTRLHQRIKKCSITHGKTETSILINLSSNKCIHFATEHNTSALTLHKVFSSRLLLTPASFLDIRWQPLSLQTPAICWLAYPTLLSHLEFPMEKKTIRDKSITDCTSVLFWDAEELLEHTFSGALSQHIQSFVFALPSTKEATGAFLPRFHVTHAFTWKSPSKNNQGLKHLIQTLLLVRRTSSFCKQSLTNFC